MTAEEKQLAERQIALLKQILAELKKLNEASAGCVNHEQYLGAHMANKP